MRKVAVVTGSRADYGLLSPVLAAMRLEAGLVTQLIVTGMHLAPQFGRTVEKIEEDGRRIDARVEMLLAGDTPASIVRSLGLGVIGMADALGHLRPDLILVLGDRFEILAAAQAALLLGIPIAHIHGGELTAGANDDAMRHAITKMASLHFVAAPDYGRRVVQMGEPPEHVRIVGAVGVEAALALEPEEDRELDESLGLPLRDPTLLVTYHPETKAQTDGPAIDAMLSGLRSVAGARIVITGVNADAGHEAVAQALRDFVACNSDHATLHASLGQRRYFSVMRRAAAVVGNSSSGVIEAPAFGVPTVNIGERQQGRLRVPSIIDCEPRAEAVAAALSQALDPVFRSVARSQDLPWRRHGTAKAIAAGLAAADLTALRSKAFHDLPVPGWA